MYKGRHNRRIDPRHRAEPRLRRGNGPTSLKLRGAAGRIVRASPILLLRQQTNNRRIDPRHRAEPRLRRGNGPTSLKLRGAAGRIVRASPILLLRQQTNNPGSSNGRTGGSGPPNRGSNPCPGTNMREGDSFPHRYASLHCSHPNRGPQFVSRAHEFGNQLRGTTTPLALRACGSPLTTGEHQSSVSGIAGNSELK